ncbi:MAG: MFS transporter [Deltaproteobacteria bacterium]|nr:MAG: MFS transporter [Deltaproteobacteria bacterium]
MPRLFTPRFWLLLAGQFLQNLSFASLPLVPLLLLHLGATRTEIGTLMAAGGIGAVASRPLVGWALDTIGRRPVLHTATLLSAATIAWLAWIPSLGPALWLNRILFGAAMGAAATAWFTLAIDGMPSQRRTEGIALFGIAGLAGLIVNPIAGELGLGGGDVQRIFPWVALVVALSILPVLLVKDPAKPPPNHDAERRPPPGPAALVRALLHPRLAPVWIATLVFAAIFSAILYFGAVAAETRNVPKPTWLWFTYAGGAITVRLLGARLPDRIGPHNLVAPSLGLYAVALLLAAHAHSTSTFLAAGLLGGLAHGTFFPCAASLAIGRMPDDMRGTALATFTALLEMASFIAAPVFGWIADLQDDATMFTTAAAIGFVGIAAWTLLENAVSKSGNARFGN